MLDFGACLQRADLAAAPMYLTSQRAEFVDFTTTFMDVYATILLRRATTHPTINSLEVKPVATVVKMIRYSLLNSTSCHLCLVHITNSHC